MTGADGQFRMMHTMIRVKDLDASIAFYTGAARDDATAKR